MSTTLDAAEQTNHDTAEYFYKERYIAYLDILGFSNMIENNTDETRLKEIVKSFWDGFNRSVDESRTVSDMDGETKIVLKGLNFRLISDSIIIWTDDGSYKSFRYLLSATSCLLSYGIQNGFPLRGAINYGGFVVYKSKEEENTFFRNESIYGQAFVEAVRVEENLNWSGCILLPSAWQQLTHTWDGVTTQTDNPNEFIQKFPHLVWYSVPLKKGNIYAVAINWNSEASWEEKKTINPFLTEMSFYAYRKHLDGTSKLAIESKIAETKRFLEYTNSLREIQKTSWSVIPIPDMTYIEANNNMFLEQMRRIS